MKTRRLSVILPTYNESENIIPVISRIEKAVNPREIIIVDDNSPDNTGPRVAQYQLRHNNVKCIINSSRLGLAASIQKGIDNAHSPYIAWMDADLSHPPELLMNMFNRIKSSDIIVASWLIKKGKDERWNLYIRKSASASIASVK